jgi:hypothetical protein
MIEKENKKDKIVNVIVSGMVLLTFIFIVFFKMEIIYEDNLQEKIDAHYVHNEEFKNNYQKSISVMSISSPIFLNKQYVKETIGPVYEFFKKNVDDNEFVDYGENSN